MTSLMSMTALLFTLLMLIVHCQGEDVIVEVSNIYKSVYVDSEYREIDTSNDDKDTQPTTRRPNKVVTTPKTRHEVVSTPEARHEVVSTPEARHEVVSTPEARHEVVSTPEARHEVVSTPEARHEVVSTPEAQERTTLKDEQSSTKRTNEVVITPEVRNEVLTTPGIRIKGAGVLEVAIQAATTREARIQGATLSDHVFHNTTAPPAQVFTVAHAPTTFRNVPTVLLDFFSVFNGHYKGFISPNDTEFRLTLKPVEVPQFYKEPMLYIEASVKEKVILMQVAIILVCIWNTDRICIQPYNFTDPNQHRPDTYNTDLLATLKPEVFHTYDNCRPFTDIRNRTEYEGYWRYCDNSPKGVFLSQQTHTDCFKVKLHQTNEYISRLGPHPHTFLLSGLRYPLLGAPWNYTNPCQ